MFKIAYCAGHHFGNAKGIPGYMGLGEVREWTLNDQVADFFAEAAAGYADVELLRTDDPNGKTFIDIPDRCAKANAWGADLYLDMHHNGGINGGSGGGVVAFSYPGSKEGKEYRDAIYEAVITAGGLKGNRAEPVQEKAFDSLRLSKMPSILMEYGFMDSKTDAPVIITDAYSKLVAYATMEGIAKVAGLKKLEETPAQPQKTVDELAHEVIAGKWGINPERKRMLAEAGYDAAAVQARVNEILSGKNTPDKTIDQLANEVIAGKWGINPERKQKLTAAGYDADAVQKRVNELLK